MTRKDELAFNLAQVQARIRNACEDAQRTPEEIELIVVTKTYPASDVVLLAELGVRHVGENRHPEAGRKKQEAAQDNLIWHFIGGLQSNKAAAVARYADVVHSVDRAKLLPGLSRGAGEANHILECLIEVRLDDSEGRAGAAAGEVMDLASQIEDAEHLVLGGMMGVAPLGENPAPAFATLAALACDLEDRFSRPMAISAGMSDDLEIAIAHGATRLRIGRAILGERPKMQ